MKIRSGQRSSLPSHMHSVKHSEKRGDAKMTLEDSQIVSNSNAGGRSHCASMLDGDKMTLNFRALNQPSLMSSSINGAYLMEFGEKCDEIQELQNEMKSQSSTESNNDSKEITKKIVK